MSCPNPKIVESYLRDTIAFSGSFSDGDQVCWSCYKFFNQILKSDVCMLSSEDIVSELKEKRKELERIVSEFEYLTPEASDVVECCPYKTALRACELVASDHPFLFPSMYRLFMQYLAEHDINLFDVFVSRSRLLTFVGCEFGRLLTLFCVDRRSGIVFHRTKADMLSLISHALHANTSDCEVPHTNFLNKQVHELANHQNSVMISP